MQYAIVLLLAVLLYLYYSTVVQRKPARRKQDNVIDIETLKKEDWMNEPLPYKKRRTLLTRKEHKCYAALLECAEDMGVVVLLKVRARDVLYLPRSVDSQSAYISRVAGKKIDFLLADSDTLEPLLAVVSGVEEEEELEKSGLFLKKACQDAGLAFLSLAEETYDVEELRHLLHPLLRPDDLVR